VIYTITLIVHSWLRWAVLGAGIAAAVRGSDRNDTAGKWFTILLDIQVLIGLLLYFALSPITAAALEDFGGTMKIPQMRFFAVEHVFGMVIGTALAHIGRARLRKAAPHKRSRTALIFYGLAILIVLASIPWPGMPAGRPLFRS
jgi:uncharacterized integral membrane protein